MSSSKWTDEQWSAITAADCSLLVSAAAGAGKTAVLVERIIRKITDEKNPVDVDRLLVVTFTRAAAAEMKERISAAIAKELNKNPASRHLHRQLTLLNRASITTLHSFCLDILRQYFYRLNLDPAFRVADDTETALLMQETLEGLFEECYDSGDSNFLALVEAYGGDRDDAYLQDIVLRLNNFASGYPWPKQWLAALAGGYRCEEGVPLEDIPWGQTVLTWLELRFRGFRSRLETAAALASAPSGPAEYLETIAANIALVDDLISAVRISWQELYNAFGAVDFGKLRTCSRKDADETLKKRVQKARDEVKKAVKNIRETFFSRPPAELTADLGRVAPYVETLVGLVVEFADRYREAKKNRAMVDFSDLEHYCLQILMDESSAPGKLVPSVAAAELREHFAEVLVDEYQDINSVQETILELVSRDAGISPNRFMVGDVKQSIYRFRLADPQLFMRKYDTYPREEGLPERGIDLTRNFRSRPEIIDAVNFIFRQIMTPVVGEITYDRRAELTCGSDYPPLNGKASAAGPAELYIIEKQLQRAPAGSGAGSEDPENSDSAGSGLRESADNAEGQDYVGESETAAGVDEPEDLDAVQREARLVARRIREMVTGSAERPGPEFFVFDKKAAGYRPVQYRDIVVLLRATANWANTFLEEFRGAGIPAYADLDTGYFKATEVETVMSLLKVIDNPRQDIPLAGVLRSPIVGLNAGEMAFIRLQDTHGEFYDAVCKAAENTVAEPGSKLRQFLDKLEEWRTLARRGPLSELLWRIYNDTGYFAYVGGMPGGAQRQANLRALHDRARQYEATAFRGLFRFLRFIEKFQESGSDLGAAPSVGENEDVVRVLSIHKSKGLEFPVVIVAGLGKQFNTGDSRQKALLHKELGLGLPVVDPELRITYPTVAYTAIARRLHMDMLAEEMRILYVALTRAREKLILVGSVKDLGKTAASWCECVTLQNWPLPDFGLASARCFMDWIGPAVARHPEGREIRKLAFCETEPAGYTAGDRSSWRVVPVSGEINIQAAGEDTENQAVLVEAVRNLGQAETAGEFAETVDARLKWKYPFQAVAGKAAKATVTEIKRRFAPESPDGTPGTGIARVRHPLNLVRPRFLQKTTGLSAAEYGSAMHLVMQNLDFCADLSEKGILRQVEDMVAAELLTVEQAEAVDISAIRGFVCSPLGQRVAAGKVLQREVPFTMAVPAAKIYDAPETEVKQLEQENVLVQGVIDLMIDEGDGYVIIDYKTDRMSPGQAEEAVSRYRGQLDLYALAVEKILHRPVKEKYLYLFALGQEVRCG